MLRQEKPSRSGFVIKLSSETAQKIADEEQKANEVVLSEQTSSTECLSINKNSDNASKEVGLNEEISDDVMTPTEDSDKVETDNILKKTVNNEKSEHSNPDWGDYAPYVTYDGDQAIYTDPTTHQKYVWDDINNSWVSKGVQLEVPGREYSFENDTHVYTEADGTKFFWDETKKAWLPKIDDDFLALYQMSYGFIDNTSDTDKKDKETVEKSETQKKLDTAGVKRKNEPQWFQASEENNTKVYVSNLPLDMNEEEFVNLMQKCGLVERDLSTQKMKVKLYMDKEHNCFKGDALCTYIKVESVDLALKLLDGSDYKGHTIKVERAHFQLKGEYNPALKPKKKKKKELEKIKKMQQKLFDWRPEKIIGERSKHEKVVIVKNLFQPTDFDKDVQLILDYQQDLREECAKSGEVRKVVIYDRHPEGVAQITMKEPEQADAVVLLINGRWFGKRQITAEIWDGRTKYRIAETDADINKRIEKWDKFLEETDDKNSGETNTNKPPDKQENEEKTNVKYSGKTNTDKPLDIQENEAETNVKKSGETSTDKPLDREEIENQSNKGDNM